MPASADEAARLAVNPQVPVVHLRGVRQVAAFVQAVALGRLGVVSLFGSEAAESGRR